MYLPGTSAKSKHRRSLNLLEVPHPQHGPHVKQHKVGEVDPYTSLFLYMTLEY